MKKIFVLFFVFFVFFVTTPAQEAEKFDAFGELPCEDLRSRSDSFLIYLRDEPTAAGFVIVYEGKYSRPIYDLSGKVEYKDYLPAVGEAKYRMQVIAGHFKYRKFPVDRISVIDGGFRENFTAEFWIVPTGAKPPTPAPTIDKAKYRKGKPSEVVCKT